MGAIVLVVIVCVAFDQIDKNRDREPAAGGDDAP
jgi:hypothetical protein